MISLLSNLFDLRLASHGVHEILLPAFKRLSRVQSEDFQLQAATLLSDRLGAKQYAPVIIMALMGYDSLATSLTEADISAPADAQCSKSGILPQGVCNGPDTDANLTATHPLLEILPLVPTVVSLLHMVIYACLTFVDLS